MATTLEPLVAALRDQFAGQLTNTDGFYTDNQLAQVIRAAMAWHNVRHGHKWGLYTIGELSDAGNATTDSTVSPDLDPDQGWGAVVLLKAIHLLAERGAVVAGVEDAGSYSGPGGSVSTSSRASGHRLNAKMLADTVREAIDGMKHYNVFTIKSITVEDYYTT